MYCDNAPKAAVKRRRSRAHIYLFPARHFRFGLLQALITQVSCAWTGVHKRGPGGRVRRTFAWCGHAMSIFALVILRGPINLAFPYICAKAVAAQGNRLV